MERTWVHHDLVEPVSPPILGSANFLVYDILNPLLVGLSITYSQSVLTNIPSNEFLFCFSQPDQLLFSHSPGSRNTLARPYLLG